jgi:gamma-glutamyltranspeptidase/glutathione hydrolase
MRRTMLALGALLVFALPLGAASRPPLHGTGGAVVADEKLAAEAGAEILRAGGNAADAAVATALAELVVGPEAANLGGGGFAVLRMKGEVAFLDFRETAPAKARPDLYLDAKGEPIPEASLVGPLAAGIPGSPAGLYELHAKYGKLPWAKVVAPAIELAAKGFPLSTRAHDSLRGEQQLLARFPETAAAWLPGGAPPPPGTVLKLPALAATLERYAAEGPKAVTGGQVAAALVAASDKYGGILTAEDLAGYRPVWRQPLRYQALGWQLAGPDLPAAGGIILAGSLNLLDKLDYAKEPRFGAARAHLLAEVLRRANADRFLLGDPSTSLAKSSDLLDPRWLATRLAGLRRDRATSSDEVGAWSAAAAKGGESSETTHIAVVDGEGQAVSLTTTLNGLYGCGLWVPEAGFFLNNEMDDFATAPGKPNLYGLIQGEANAVGPGKRMLSSQSPTVAWREDGSEVVALGGRGGSRIPTAALQILIGFLLDGDSLQAAVDRPRIHHQWRPDVLYHEPDALSPETRAALGALGHQIEEFRGWVAQAHAVRYQRQGGRSEAAPDPRGGGGHGAVAIPWP